MPVSKLTPAERTLRASHAALTRWSKADAVEGTTKAREAFNARFENEVDPDRVLDPAERAVRATRARKAYFAALALKSLRARRAATEQGGGDAA